MNSLIKYGLFALVIGGVYLFTNSDKTGYAENDIDLNAVLDVTLDTLYKYQESLDEQDQENLESTSVFIAFSEELSLNLSQAEPSIHDQRIVVAPQEDASMLAYEDLNSNDVADEGEDILFMIEIDGENSRIIATSHSGAINEHHFSGTGLLAGYLIGSMLTRQRASGVDTKKLGAKQPVTARAAARTRAGSGSHSKGK